MDNSELFEVKSRSQCSVCGEYRGCRGKSGYPLGCVGELGPCGHEESRGPRGEIKTPKQKQRSKDYKKRQREMKHQSIAVPLAIERTDYNYCKSCGGPLRDPSVPCIFCNSKIHLASNREDYCKRSTVDKEALLEYPPLTDKSLEEIIIIVKLICIDKCSHENMLIINSQLDELQNTLKGKLGKYDFMSTLTEEEKYKIMVTTVNILAVVTSKEFAV